MTDMTDDEQERDGFMEALKEFHRSLPDGEQRGVVELEVQMSPEVGQINKLVAAVTDALAGHTFSHAMTALTNSIALELVVSTDTEEQALARVERLAEAMMASVRHNWPLKARLMGKASE